MNRLSRHIPAALFFCMMAACNRPSAKENVVPVNSTFSSPASIPANMHYVTAITHNDQSRSNPAPMNEPPAALKIGQGQFFSYALPPGWRLGEDGQFALSLAAPDNLAFTVMTGNSGYMPDYQPGQFIYEKMMALRPANLQIGQGQQTNPVQGFRYAYTFPVSYDANGQSYKGIATCHVQPYYGGSVMAMTAAISQSGQWGNYASWLPQVSTQISASNGAAFGMRGLMQQNLRNSMAFAEAAKEYRNWSQQKQQELNDYRGAVTDRQQEAFRDNIGAIQRYDDPYNNGTQVQLPSRYEYYWMDRQGKILGSNDPNADPNNGAAGEWTKMGRSQR